MSIYLHQNDKQTGPFSEDQVLQMLQASIVSFETLGWKEGMAAWAPLSTFISSSAKGIPPAPPQRSSPLGLISFIFSLVSMVGWIILLGAAGIAHNDGTANQTFNMIVGFFFLGGVFLNLSALVLGVIGAFKSKANTLALIGACLNALILVGLVVLICIGLAAKHAA